MNGMAFNYGWLAKLLDPAPIIYSVTAWSTALVGISMTLFVFFAAIRAGSESVKHFEGNGSWYDYIKKTLSSYSILIAYTLIGGMFTLTTAVISSFFVEHGSFSIIAKDLADLYKAIKAQDREHDENLFTWMLEAVSIFGAGGSYVFFLIASTSFAVLHNLLRLIYAVYFVMVYLLGFLVFSTRSFGRFDLTSVWYKSLIGLAMWPACEMLLFGIIKFKIENMKDDVLAMTAQSGTFSSMATFFTSLGIIFILLIIFKLASMWMAVQIAKGSEVLSSLGAPAQKATEQLAARGADAVRNSSTSQGIASVGRGANYINNIPSNLLSKFKKGK